MSWESGQMAEAKRIMGAAVSMPLKHHDEMKLGKSKKTAPSSKARKPKKRSK
jgi:hypothetical protein